MKQIFTALFAFCFAMSLSAQTYIWGGPGDANSEFNGGLNDWTTVGVAAVPQDSAANAVWIWDADGTDAGDAYAGAYSGAGTRIESASVANGVALFPSDYYDNNGVRGGFGTGHAPAGGGFNGQRGELISPVIDCSNHQNVAVQFTQSFRRFSASIPSLEVTNDGVTWESYELNPFPAFNGIDDKTTRFGVDVNQATAVNSVQIVDISSVAGGQANVQFRFVFEGGYYYWFIDDVYVIESPASNLSMTHYFYTPGSFAAPASQIATDTFVFIAGIQNKGGSDATNVQLVATVRDVNNNVVYADSVNVGSIEPDSVAIAEIPARWAPEVPEGAYTITWEANSLDGVDFNTQDNGFVAQFLATASTYSKEGATTVPATNRTAATTEWRICNLYTTGPEMAGGYFEANSFTTVLSHDNGLEGQVASFYLAKIIDFDNFDVTNLDLFDHPNLELVGLSFPDPFTAAQEDQFVTLPLYDFNIWDQTGDFEVGADLEANENYLLIADFPALMQIGFTATPVYFQVSTVVVSNGQWFFGGFGPDFNAVLRMDVAFTTSVDEKQLADNVMQVFPNPASDYFNVDLNFETATDATIAVADMTGKVVDMKYVKGVQQQQVTFAGAQFASGSYLVRVITNEGSLTKRVVVQK